MGRMEEYCQVRRDLRGRVTGVSVKREGRGSDEPIEPTMMSVALLDEVAERLLEVQEKLGKLVSIMEEIKGRLR